MQVRFSESLASNSQESMQYVSLKNRPCQARLTLVNINPRLFFIHLLLVLISVCGSCNIIDDLNALVSVDVD